MMIEFHAFICKKLLKFIMEYDLLSLLTLLSTMAVKEK